MSAAPGTSIPAVIGFTDPAGKPQCHRPDASRILAGDPQQTASLLYQSADGRFVSGIWECEPGKWRVVFTESEFCHLLEGEIVVRGDDGSERTFRAGEAFLSPAGFTGTWDVTRRAKKYFACYE
jgi:hypothetical protein